MLQYNINRLFKMKGVSNPVSFLIKAGFNKDTAYRIASNRLKLFPISYLEKLCLAFECTPNDLIELIPDEKHTLASNHPLNKLLPGNEIMDLRNIAVDIPLEKLGKFAERIAELKKEL